MIVTYEKFKQFEGKWVALNEKTQKVLCASTNLSNVQKQAEKKSKDKKNVVLQYILPFNRYIAPNAH